MAKKIMHGVFFCVQVKGAARAGFVRTARRSAKKEYDGKILKGY